MIGDILQPTHLIFILVVALLVLGPKRLPEVGRSLGRGMRDFKDALTTDDRDRDEIEATTSTPATPVETAPPVVSTVEPKHGPAESASA